MPQKVIITTDSTCDLDAKTAKEYGIAEIIPLKILLGNEEHLDGVDIAPDDVYNFYNKTGTLPKTAAVTPLEYTEIFSKYVNEGCAVVHISFTSKLSSSCQNARVAAMDFDDVHIVDSLQLCSGQALVAFKACELRDKGLSAEEIAKEVQAFVPKIKTNFVISTLEYLTKGGRCSALTAFGANILGIKPAIDMNDGSLGVGKKYRGKIDSVYEKYIIDKINNYGEIDTSCKVFFADSGIAPEQRDKLLKLVKENIPGAEILKARAGCTISSHAGPATVGLMFAVK